MLWPTCFLPGFVVYLALNVTGCLWTGHRQWQMQAPYRCMGLTPVLESVGAGWLRCDQSVRPNKLLMLCCMDNNELAPYAGRPGSNSRVPDCWGNLTLQNALPRSGSCGPHADEGLHRSTRATNYNAPSLGWKKLVVLRSICIGSWEDVAKTRPAGQDSGVEAITSHREGFFLH